MALLTPFKEARLRAGLSQDDLALRAGVAKSTVSAADRGMLPTDRVRAALATALLAREGDLFPDLGQALVDVDYRH